MESPPSLHLQSALFLDFDGTLVDIAETPDAVHIAPGLIDTLTALHGLLGGALAIVSGRQIDALDRFLEPLVLPSAGEHGAQLRNALGELEKQAPPDLSAIVQAANALSVAYPGVIVERKHAALSVHYRLAPSREDACRSAMQAAAAHNPRLEVMFGKCVVDIKLASINKGVAIDAFMQQAPFAGRTPVFLGDDTTDESGFTAVQRMQGIAVKIGNGPSGALHRLADPAAVLHWLASARDQLTVDASART
jgi:trehalose 6-phosphate phosphatase